MFRFERGGRQIAETRMRPDVVVVATPRFDADLGVDPPLHRARAARDLPRRGSPQLALTAPRRAARRARAPGDRDARPRGAGLARSSARPAGSRGRDAHAGAGAQASAVLPFFVAEPYTKRPGLHVSHAEALRGRRAILAGEVDALPEQAFYFTGTLDDVLKAAAAMPPAAPGAPSPARPG